MIGREKERERERERGGASLESRKHNRPREENEWTRGGFYLQS